MRTAEGFSGDLGNEKGTCSLTFVLSQQIIGFRFRYGLLPFTGGHPGDLVKVLFPAVIG